MSDKPFKNDRSNATESSSSKEVNRQENEVSVESFQTATATESGDSFRTARTSLDPDEVEDRLQSLLAQNPRMSRTISSLMTVKENDVELRDEESVKHLRFQESDDDKRTRTSDQETGSIASLRIPRENRTAASVVSTDESEQIEYLTQFNRLNRLTDSFAVNKERIGQIDQLDITDSDSDFEPREVNRPQTPLHSGLDSKSAHSIKSTHSMKSVAGLGGGHAFIYMVIPPDGGYGWLITFISFLCQVVVDGIIFGIGIVLPDMAEDLGVTASKIALVASMQIGPVSCAFINKYGFRPVALVGTVISVTSIAIASFSINLPMLIVFYSLIGGVSLSMIWVSSQLIIGYYFEKYRPIANGLSCSGAGAGILIFSAMNSMLVSEIGWRNVLRVHLIFLVCVFFMAITFVEVAPQRIGQIFEPASETTSESSEADELRSSVRYSKTSTYSSEKVEEKGIADMIETYQVLEKKPGLLGRCLTCCCPTFLHGRISTATGIETKRYVIRSDPLEKQDLYYMGPADYDNNRDELIQDVLEGKQVEIVGSRKNARSINYTLSMMHASRIAEKDVQDKKDSCFAYLAPANWLPKKVVNAFRVLFDMRLLSMTEFQILLASAFFYPMGFNIPFVYSKVRANLPTHQTSLISPAIGLSNFAFRIASGFVAYKFKEYTTYICGGGIAFGGMAVVISAFYGDDVFWFQMVYAISFGIAPALYSTLRAIIYVRALGLDKLTNAFGLTAMAMGIGVFIGTTLAGYLNQETGGFVASFTFGGSCMVLAGMLKLFLPAFMEYQRKRIERRQSPKVKFSL